MKKLIQIFLLISLSLGVISVKAQDVTAKEILAQAAKAVLDTGNIVTVVGTDIKAGFTAVKMQKGQNADLQKGFYAGILELDVRGDYGKLKSGKFNIFFKSGGKGLFLYFEEKGKISTVLEATDKAPIGFKDAKIGDKPVIDFVEIEVDDKLSLNYPFKLNLTSSLSAFYTSGRRCKIYIKIIVGGRGYWVWSGAYYKRCRHSAT